MIKATIRVKYFLAIFVVSFIFILISVIVMNIFLSRLAMNEITQGLRSGVLAFERFAALRDDLLANQARSISQTPHLKAVMNIPDVDSKTVYYTARELYDINNIDLMLLIDDEGKLIADAEDTLNYGSDMTSFPGVLNGLDGIEYNGIYSYKGDLYLVALTPVVIGKQLLGLLIIGDRIDSTTAEDIREFTGRDVLLVYSQMIISQSNQNKAFLSVNQNELTTLLDHFQTFNSPFYCTLGEKDCLAVVISLKSSGGYTVLFRALDEVNSVLTVAKISLLGAGGATILLAAILSFWLSARVSRPILNLRDAVRQFGAGKLDQRITVPSQDELGQLSSAFNKMAEDIHSARKALESERDYVHSILHSMIEMLIVLNPDGKIRAVNQAAVKSLHYSESELVGRSFQTIIYSAREASEKKPLKDIWETLIKNRFVRDIEGVLLSKENREIPVIISCSVMSDNQDRIQGVVCVAQDISVRIEAEKDIRKLSVAVEQSPSAVVITDIDGNINYVNPKFEKVSGYMAEEVLGKNPRILKSGKQPREYYKELWDTIKSGKEWRGEFCNRKKNGDIFWVHAYVSPIIDGEGNITNFLSVQEDITERKRSEKLLENSQKQLQALSSHIQRLQEDERARIAREIHDQLGQSLTGMKMDLAWLKDELPEKYKPLIDSIIDLANSTMTSVRKISTQLRPGVLDDLGLMAAIDWQVEEFQERSGIECDLRIDSEDITIDHDRSTAIFRILQEALTNVLRHADASKVIISLSVKDGILQMKVVDNGKGIHKTQVNDRKSLGLLGMKERLLPWGGRFKIGSVNGSGTIVNVWLPLINEQSTPEVKV
ncbi:MAG: PAS domain S-box protein [Fidelibacterota bacterium]